MRPEARAHSRGSARVYWLKVHAWWTVREFQQLRPGCTGLAVEGTVVGPCDGPYSSRWSRTPSFPLPAARPPTPRAGLCPHPGIWTVSVTGLTGRQWWKQHSGTCRPVMGLITPPPGLSLCSLWEHLFLNAPSWNRTVTESSPRPTEMPSMSAPVTGPR